MHFVNVQYIWQSFGTKWAHSGIMWPHGTETVINIRIYISTRMCVYFFCKEQSCAVRVGSLQRSAKELRKFVVNFLLLRVSKSSCLLKHLLFYDFSAKKASLLTAAATTTAFNKLEEICLMRLRLLLLTVSFGIYKVSPECWLEFPNLF